MKRAPVLVLFAALGVALWVELQPAPPRPPATFSYRAIQDSVLRLQPALERALDEPFDPPIDVRVVTPLQMADVLAGDMQQFAREGNERDGAETWAPLLGRNLATMVFAKVELGSSRLNVTPRVFGRLDEMTNRMFALTTPEFRDALLLHEMVHVHQMRRIDAKRYFGRPDTVGKLQARSSVIEGHAQYVAQRVARHIGLNEAFEDLLGVTTGEIEGLPESSRRIIRMASGMQAFPYYRGQQMVERVVRERGYEEAVAAMLETPPPDEIAVVTPSQYLPTPPGAARFARAVDRVVRLLDDGLQTERATLSSVDLRLEWEDVPLDRMREFLQPFVTAERIEDYFEGRVELHRCRDEASTRAFLDVLEFGVVNDDMAWEATPLEIEPGLQARRLDRKPPENDPSHKPWIRHRALLTSTGPICILLRFKRTEVRDGADLRLAQRVVELVRSTYTRSPWSGLRGDAAANAIVRSVDDPHWGVRWRAARNLGRLPQNTDGAKDAALRALEDKNPNVRVAALETFKAWDAVASIPAPLVDSLKSDSDREVADKMWGILNE